MPSARTTLIPALGLQGRTAIGQAIPLCGFLLLAIALGGSSASGIAANAVLQVAAVIALAATLGWASPTSRGPGERHLLILCGLFVALFVVQSVPLPPALWTALPGRQPIAAGLATLGGPLPWMPVTLAPGKTLHSALALLPPLAVIVMLGAFRRPVGRAAVVTLLAAMVVSVLIGVAQVSGSNGLYLYAFTNGGSAVGFFANANHLGTLLCMTMPLAAGFVARLRGGRDGEQAVSRVVAIVFLLAILLLALLGVVMTKSIASLLLSIMALAGSAAIMLSGLDRRLRLGFLGGVIAAVVIVAIVVYSNGIGEYGGSALANSEMGRREYWQITGHAIAQFGAIGSGFGSFPQLFHLFEDPDAVTLLLANHAHNDLLEFVLEAGIPGIVLLGLFLLWFGLRFVSVWLIARRRDPLAQGASIGVLVALLHSLVDYPLRTAAVATLFGLCLGLLARQPAGGTSEETAAELAPVRHLSA